MEECGGGGHTASDTRSGSRRHGEDGAASNTTTSQDDRPELPAAGREFMSTASETFTGGDAGVGLLDKERIVARPGFNRWLVPPAALAIHLCIGMA